MRTAEAYNNWYNHGHGQWMGQRELELLLQRLEIRPGESLLDVGCGTGFFTRALAGAGLSLVAGLDINADWLQFARQQKGPQLHYLRADACALPFADASFDLVISTTALCFIEDERAALQEMVRIARRRLAIGLLNRHSLLWLEKRHKTGSSYEGARWHSPAEAVALLKDLPLVNIRIDTAIHWPWGARLGQVLEPLWPGGLQTGSFLLVTADKDDCR